MRHGDTVEPAGDDTSGNDTYASGGSLEANDRASSDHLEGVIKCLKLIRVREIYWDLGDEILMTRLMMRLIGGWQHSIPYHRIVQAVGRRRPRDLITR